MRYLLACAVILASASASAQEGPPQAEPPALPAAACADCPLDWADPGGDRPEGALNPRREPAIDEGHLVAGATLFGMSYGFALLFVYDEAVAASLGSDHCTDAPGLAAIPVVGGFLIATTGATCDEALYWVYGILSALPQAIGLAMVIVSLIAPAAHETVYEEGAELAVLPYAPHADAGLSLRMRW
jgi:hypothetical protein